MSINSIFLASMAMLSTAQLYATTSAPLSQNNSEYCDVNISPDDPLKFVEQHVIHIPDTDNEVVRTYHVEQKINGAKLCNGDSIISLNAYMVSVFNNHDGAILGRYIFGTKNGDKIKANVTANSQLKSGKKHADVQCTAQITGGTGPYKAASGDVHIITEVDWKTQHITAKHETLRIKLNTNC